LSIEHAVLCNFSGDAGVIDLIKGLCQVGIECGILHKEVDIAVIIQQSFNIAGQVKDDRSEVDWSILAFGAQ